MRTFAFIGLAVAFTHGVSAACSAALKVDDFTKWSSNTNSLNEWTSDDASMTSISASGGILSFKPKSSSYFYESFACQAATSTGYNSVQFTVKGPASGSLTLEIQTKSACSATAYTSYYTSVTGLTGSSQTITVPFSSFSGANGNAITAILWSDFSSTTATWQISNVQFGCGGSVSTSKAATSSKASSTLTSVKVTSSSSKASSTSAKVTSSSFKASSTSLKSSSSSSKVSSTSLKSSSSSFKVSSTSLKSSSSSIQVSTSTKTSASTAATTGSLDGSCGGTLEYTCIGTTFGDCCSQYGWCGTTTDHCGTGCNPLYGKCPSSSSSSIKSSSSSVKGTSSSIASTSIKTSSSSVKSTSSTTSSSVKTTLTTSAPSASGTCASLLIDDWASQSRLTFLFYNSLIEPSSDDGSFSSLQVGVPSKNRVTLTPKDTSSYFYTQLGCTNAKNIYGGISLRIKAPAGTTFSIQLESSTTCDPTNAVALSQTNSQLGWTFDGSEKLYTIPFSKFTNLNTEKLTTLLFSGFNQAVSFGPVAFYCGSTGTEFIVTTTTAPAGPSSTVAAPTGTAAALVVDKFASSANNALGFWHGADEGMQATYSGGKLTLTSSDADYSFYSQVSGSCSDFSKYSGSYLHIAYSGSTAFTVALQQHNSQCNEAVAPYPETWDSAEAARYANNGHIYIPINHFKINLVRTVGIVIKSFYTASPVTLSLIEIVPSVPAGTVIPNKLETGDLVFACKRPNSFAFAIDDGSPELAQDVLKIVREEGIKVTFFTVGAPLLDLSNNLTNVYREMQANGHQIALHSYTHPKMESLPDNAAIDWEYNEDIKAVAKQLDGLHTPYFRPPFGNEGARMRQRLAQTLGEKPTITMWSVDVEDWLWAETDTPEEQLKAFQRDVDKGGNLVVLHYLYPSTVSYLRQFIQIAKATGKELMRVDQCMMDPNAPSL